MSDNSSSYSIQEAKVTAYDGITTSDISNIIHSINFSQSLSSVIWSGSIVVRDNVGLLERLPLRGEESLKLKILSYDTNKTIDLNTKIFRVSGIQPTENQNGVQYTLSIVSGETFEANKQRATKAYKNDKISGIADKVFNEYYATLGVPETTELNDTRTLSYSTKRLPIERTDRSFFIQPTEGLFTLIMPNYIPPEAMVFLSKRGYNSETRSQTFRFFETFYNYYFVTDEFLIQEGVSKGAAGIKKLFYAPAASYDTSNPESQLQRIDSLTIEKRGTDTASDLYSGGYTNKVSQVDIINGTYDEFDFNFLNDAKYIDMTGRQADLSNLPHTEEYIRDTFTSKNAKRFMIFKDFDNPEQKIAPSMRSEVNLQEVIANKISYNHHLNNTSILVGMKGRLDITPGEIVDVDTTEFESTETTNRSSKLSGRYLVQSSKNVLMNDTISTSLRLVKFNWSS